MRSYRFLGKGGDDLISNLGCSDINPDRDRKDENTNKISSPIIDIKTDFQINDQFSSPLPKKYLIHENQNFNKSYDKNVNIKNDNNIYSPYVKRIDISGKKLIQNNIMKLMQEQLLNQMIV